MRSRVELFAVILNQAEVARALLVIRSTRTGTKSRIGLPANCSCELCTVSETTSGGRSGNDATLRWVTSVTALVSSSGDNIQVMLPPLSDDRQHPAGGVHMIVTAARTVAATNY